jgi:hypothetical protein
MKNWMMRERAWISTIALIAALATMSGCVNPLAGSRASDVSQMIAPETAEGIALAEYPGATVMETELAEEGGASYYVVELQSATGVVEVQIDSNSGALIAANMVTDAGNDETEDSQEGASDTSIETDDGQAEDSQEGASDTSIETDDGQAEDSQEGDSNTSIDADDSQIEDAHDGGSNTDIDADDGRIESAQERALDTPTSGK